MNPSSFSRRQFLAAAGVSAVGLAIKETNADEAARPESPRLPCSILVRGLLEETYLEQIKKLSPQITVGNNIALAKADVMFGNIAENEVPAAKKLRWIQCQSAGVEHYPLAAMDKANITLTNAQGCYAPAIAEHVFALLFGLTRGVVQQARQRKFGYEPTPPEMRGMTMGIIGLGGIGRDVARRAKAMDMKVIAVDAEPMFVEKFSMVDEVRLVDDGLMDILGRSDVVVCAAPHTVKSRGMLGADQFAAMKNGAYFINVSRGKIVKTNALLKALNRAILRAWGWM